MAKGEDYSWIFYLVFVFFIFILPILKKAAEALTGKKEDGTGRAPGSPGAHARKERSPAREMLDEVEDFFRKSRAPAKQEPEQKILRQVPERPGRSSDFDAAYRERKRRIEEGRRRREEQKRKRRAAGALREPGAAPLTAGVKPDLGRLKPVIGEEPQGLVVDELPAFKSTLEAQEPEAATAREEPEESLSAILGEMPETARMVVYQEILSPPKSLREL